MWDYTRWVAMCGWGWTLEMLLVGLDTRYVAMLWVGLDTRLVAMVWVGLDTRNVVGGAGH